MATGKSQSVNNFNLTRFFHDDILPDNTYVRNLVIDILRNVIIPQKQNFKGKI